MFSLAGRKPVDLSPRIKARIHRLDGSVEEGTADPYGRPWVMQEGRFPGDNSLFTLYSAPVGGDDVWHQERLSTHHGSMFRAVQDTLAIGRVHRTICRAFGRCPSKHSLVKRPW